MKRSNSLVCAERKDLQTNALHNSSSIAGVGRLVWIWEYCKLLFIKLHNNVNRAGINKDLKAKV